MQFVMMCALLIGSLLLPSLWIQAEGQPTTKDEPKPLINQDLPGGALAQAEVIIARVEETDLSKFILRFRATNGEQVEVKVPKEVFLSLGLEKGDLVQLVIQKQGGASE